MALPADIPTVTLTGTWIDWTGQPCTGTVTITPTALTRLVDTANNTAIMPATISVTLDDTGSISVQIPATSTPALAGSDGMVYTVGVNVTAANGQQMSPYSCQVVAPAGSPPICVTTPQYAVTGASVSLPSM